MADRGKTVPTRERAVFAKPTTPFGKMSKAELRVFAEDLRQALLKANPELAK